MKNSLRSYLVENSRLTDVERDAVVACFEQKHCKKHDIWVRGDTICAEIAFVASGILRVYNEVDGEEVTHHFVFPNSFSTSLTSLAFGVKGKWTIQALTDCQLLIIDRDAHFRLLAQYSSWMEVDNVLLLKAYTELENRMFDHLYMDSKTRFDKLLAEHGDLFNAVPLKYIASYLGIKPETLSRLRNSLT